MNCDICFWNKHFGIEMKSNTTKISMANGKWFLLISSSRPGLVSILPLRDTDTLHSENCVY